MLLVVVNLLVMLTLGLIAALIIHARSAPVGGNSYGNNYGYGYGYGLNLQSLFIWCFIIGMSGAFFSLAISRWIAKRLKGVQVIDPDTNDPQARQLVQTVYRLAQSAGLSTMPEVGVYNSPEINAFATGPSRSRALVAVSSGLLTTMRPSDVEGVLGHEITHVANGDMVTMTLIQGLVNVLAMFLAEIVVIFLSQQDSRDNRGGGGFFMRYMIYNLVYSGLAFLGLIVINGFSRWREFRADAGGAHLAGRDHMISALRALQRVHEAGADQIGQQQPALQALMISGKTESFIGRLFADHPPLDERIARLEQMPA